jgi:hypothetical protein
MNANRPGLIAPTFFFATWIGVFAWMLFRVG